MQGQFQDLYNLVPEDLKEQVAKAWFGKIVQPESLQFFSSKQPPSSFQTLPAGFVFMPLLEFLDQKFKRICRKAVLAVNILWISSDTRNQQPINRLNMQPFILLFSTTTGAQLGIANLHSKMTLYSSPNAPIGLLNGKWTMPHTEIIQTKLHISYMMPGAIAGSVVLLLEARWAFSADTKLTAISVTTGINYQADFDAYLNKIHTALYWKEAWVKHLFDYWDPIIFPNQELRYSGTDLGSQ
ncbi:hypothetical protein GYMLUDRAFT_65110 [Collybiopsis luxurians FD-317 M1]|uniref:Uncharacterized protein n=1 Tax=Collybiopsis luxurians FD-317 M1 TaxID=944289 RepID=A0A0D0B9H0_9AGAR|nr:hypothetical protein GYMLUDRAFT_65110 [Collybiopsis luxurians FD-317 M1]